MSVDDEYLRGQLLSDDTWPEKFHIREDDAYFYRATDPATGEEQVRRHNVVLRETRSKRTGDVIMSWLYAASCSCDSHRSPWARRIRGARALLEIWFANSHIRAVLPIPKPPEINTDCTWARRASRSDSCNRSTAGSSPTRIRGSVPSEVGRGRGAV